MSENSVPVSLGHKAFFHAASPTYFLDLNYHFIEWNRLFSELIAKPLGLELNRHVITDFVEHFENSQAILDRATKVFAVDKVPLVDIETLQLRVPPFGLLDLVKLASQVRDENGTHVAWIVHFNVMRAEKSDAYWKEVDRVLSSSFGEK